jgi:hypothetical protein
MVDGVTQLYTLQLLRVCPLIEKKYGMIEGKGVSRHAIALSDRDMPPDACFAILGRVGDITTSSIFLQKQGTIACFTPRLIIAKL